MDPANRRRIAQALLHPFSLAIAAIGGATYALSGELWVVALAAVLMGGISIGQLRVKPPAVRVEELPPLYAERHARLSQLVARVASAIQDSSATVRECLSSVPDQVAEVGSKAHGLLAQQARIDAFLADPGVHLEPIDLRQLEHSLTGARTEAAREKFAAALANKRRDLEARERLRASSERIAAELAEIESALQNALSTVVSLDGAEAPAGSAAVSNALRDVLITVESLQQALTAMQDPVAESTSRAIGARS